LRNRVHHAGAVVGTAILVGQATVTKPRETRLRKLLIKHVDSWPGHEVAPREVI